MRTGRILNISRVLLPLCLLLVPIVQAQNGVGINTTTPKSDFEVNGSFGQKVTTVTTSTTLDATHNVVVCNNGATAIDITLPAVAAITGRIYTIKRDASSTANVRIVGTIDGATNRNLHAAGEFVTLISNGTEWKIINRWELAPMGEISYFNTTGTATGAFAAVSDGSTNMKKCTAPTTFAGHMFDNGGANDGRLRYIGEETKHFHIACTITVAQTGGGSNNLVFGVAKNGVVITASKLIQRTGGSTDFQSTAIHVAEHLSKNDYLELFAGNMSATTEIKIHSINLFAMGMSHD